MVDVNNKQSFGSPQAKLVLDGVSQEYRDNPDRFFNSTEPNLAILHEKPEHRVLIYLKAQGLSNREIAAKTGFTDAWLSQVFRQPWARQRLAVELKEAGQDELHMTLSATAMDALRTMIELQEDTDVPPAVRQRAAADLLNRTLGMPTQRVVTDNTVRHTTQDIAAIDAELKQLAVEEAHLLGVVKRN